MKESTTVGRTGGGVTDGETDAEITENMSELQDVYRLPMHHGAICFHKKDSLTPACSVAASL